MATPVKTIPRPEYNGDPEALLGAIERDDLETVITLIDAGIDIDFLWPKLSRGEGMTAMGWTSSVSREVAIMQELIRGGGDVNKADVYGWTPLHHAAYGGNEEMVKFLVGAGADINIVIYCQGYRGGYTPLHSAMSTGHIEVAGDLVRLGADATAKDDEGKTMFEVACTEQERDW
jgi:ankyrin repeat protein